METIKLYQDGNKICAIIGEMPEEKAIGYGGTITEALWNLAANIEKCHYPVCLNLGVD
jgi:hypothetical protein